MIIVNRCLLYFHEEETINHIFIHYDYTKYIWGKLWNAGKIMAHKPTTIGECLFLMSPNLKDRETKDSWVILVIHIWWQFWKERNARIFEDEYTKAKEVNKISKFQAYENILHGQMIKKWDLIFKNIFNNQ